MSQNVPILAVLVLLCAPGLVWSEEPLFSNVTRIDSSYQRAGTVGMPDRNTRSSFTNSLPVYSISNRQNAYGSASQTFHDFQSNHRPEPQKISSYVVRPLQTAKFMTSLPHGISPPEIDGVNPPGINSALRVSSLNQIISSLAATEQEDPPLSGRGDPLNKIPIYVIRPPYSGMGSPTIVNLAVLPQEQINPEIIRIIQSLRLSQDRVPLVLVAGQYPSLTADGQNNAESGINTMDFDDSTEGQRKPIRGMIAPHPLSDEEWYDEIMKHETLIHGRRHPIFPNIGRFTQVSPQLNAKPGTPPLDYWLRNPDGPQSIVPMNTERFVVPRERNMPVGFMPSQQSTLPRRIMPQDYYPPAKDLVPIGLSDSQPYQPLHNTRIPEYPTQQPQFPRSFTQNLQQKPGYILINDSLRRQQYLTYPSSDVQDSRISPYPNQQNLYSGPYNQQILYNFQIPSSPEIPPADGRAPSVHDLPEVISQMGRFIIPETPSQYPSMYPENFTGYTLPKQFYPGQQTKYPFIQKVPRDQLKHFSYPYPPDAEVTDTPEWSYLSPQFKYPEYPSTDFEYLGKYPDIQPVHPSQSPHFAPHSPPSSGNLYHPLPQYPFTKKQLPIQPRPKIHAQIEEFIIPDKEQQVPADSYPQFPSASQHVPVYQSPSADRYYPDQKPMYPSGRLVPISHTSLPIPSIHTYDDGKTILQSTPDVLSQIDKINIPAASPDPQIIFPHFNKVRNPAPNPDGTFSQQLPGQKIQYPFEHPLPDHQVPKEDARYPPTGTDVPTSTSTNTLELPSDEQLKLSSGSPDDQLSKYPKNDTDREPSKSPRPEVNSNMEEFIISEELHPSTKHIYPQFPSADDDRPTEYPDAGPQKPHKETHPVSPYDGQITHYPRQPMDDAEPQVDAGTEIASTIDKFSIPERGYPTLLQRYLQFPSAVYDGPTEYLGAGPQEPYKETHPDSPYNGQITQHPRQPMDDTEPQVEARTEIVSNIEKFSIPERGYPTLLQKYPQFPSADYEGPTKYPGGGPQKPHKETHPDPPNDDLITHHPSQPMDDTEQQVEARTEILSTVEKFSIPERGYPTPLQKYPQVPFADYDGPTKYPDAGPQKPHKEIHPNSQYDVEITQYPRQPMDDTEPQVEAGPEIVSNIEKFSILERGHPTSLPKYPQAPSSEFDEPTYYPDTVHRQPYSGTNTEFPFDGQVTDYPRHPTDDTEPHIEPRTEVVTKVEKFSIPEPLHLEPYHQKYLHAPPSDTDALKLNPDSGTRQPYRGIHPDFPYYNGQVTNYPKQPMDDAIPGMKPRTEVVSKLEKFSTPEQMKPIPQQTYPQVPSSDTNEPTYYADSGQRQPYRGAHPDLPYDQVTDYSKHPINDKEPQMRPRPDAFSNIEQFSIPEPPYTMPLQKYPNIPSSYADEPVYNSGSSPRQPYKGSHPDFPYDEQVKGYPVQLMDDTQLLMRPVPDVVSTIEKFRIPDQPFPKPQLRYPLIPSSKTGEPVYYPESSPQQPSRGQHPDFSPHGQDRYSQELLDGKKPKLRPIPGIISIMERLNIPEQPLPSLQQKVRKFPSSYKEELKNYPEIGPIGSHAGLYPDFPAYGQIPAGFPEQLIDRSEQIMRPRPVFVSELKKLEEPDIIPQQTYPQYPSSDTDDTRKYPDRGPKPYTGQKPESPSDGQTSGYPKYPYGQEEPSLRPRPETVSEIRKFYIPEQYHLEPQTGHPRYPSSNTDEPIYQPSNGIQQPYGKNPESDDRIPGYSKWPFESSEPTMTPRPEMISEIRKFNIPKDSIPVRKHPRYPPTGRDAPQMFPDEVMKPSFLEEQPWFPSDENTPGQLHYPQPSTHYENLPIQPKPDVPLQIERIYITERPPAEQTEEYQQYPSVGTADEDTGHPDTIPKSQYEPSRQPRVDANAQIGRTMVPKQQHTDQQPQWPDEGAVPTAYPDQYFPQYPSSLNRPALVKPITDPQTRKIEVPKSSSSVGQYPGIKQPKFDKQLFNQIPKFPTDISVPIDQPQQVFPQYPSSDERIPERPGIVSQIGVFKIPETPELRIQQEYPQYLSSDTKNSLPQLDTYPLQVPSDQQQPFSSIHHPVQHPPEQPPFNNMGHFLLPRPEFTAIIGKTNIPEPGQYPSTFPLQIPDTPIRQPLPDIYTSDIPKNQINVPYPSSYHQLHFPDSSPSTSSPDKPKTSGRGVEPEKQVYPKKDQISPTLDMISNEERFKIPAGPRFIPPGQGDPKYLPTDGILPQPETQSVSDLNLRESNDIDLNIERLTVPGQMSWKPGQRYPQYASTDTQKPHEYPETLSLYPHHIPQSQMKPDHHLPIGSERLSENPEQHSSSSPYRPHQHPPFPYSPREQPERKYQEYPYKDIDFLPNQPQPRLTIDVERFSRPDHPNLQPMHGYSQYPSAGDEPAFLDYGAHYPPERHVPRDHELLPSIHSFADQGFPKKQLQPDTQIRIEKFEVTEPPGSSPVDERFQNFYTTSTTSTAQPPQYYPSPNYPSQNYPDSPQSQINTPNDQTKTDITLPLGGQVQSLPNLIKIPDSTTIYPPRLLDISEEKSYSDVEIEKIKQESPSVAGGYPFPMIEISTVMQPYQDQLIHPNFIAPETYGSDQYLDSQHARPLDNPGKSSLPQMRPPNTWEGYPVDDYSPDGLRQSTIGHPTFHPDGKEPQYYPPDQPNSPTGLTPGHPSSASSPAEEPKHLKKPTVYVYPVPRRQEIPQSYVPQLDSALSGPPQPEPSSDSPGTHDYRAPIDGQTPVYPHPDPYGTSPRVLQYETTPKQPDDFPKDLSWSIQGQPKPPGSTKQLPDTVERHELDQQTSIKEYMDETSSMPSIPTQHTTSIYPESIPSQLDISRISPNGKMLYPQPSAEQIILSPTLTYPVEQQNPPSTTTMNYLSPLETNKFIPSGSVFEGMPDQRLRPDGSAPQVPPRPQDIPHTELPNGQTTSPERVQPAEEPSSSVNSLDLPYSTEGINEQKPVSSGSTTLPSEETKRGFHPDEALTTIAQTKGVGSAPDESSLIPSTPVPQVMPTRKQILPEPSSGVLLPTPSSTSIGSFPVPLDSPQMPNGPSLLPDSKITRIFPVTKPTFYTDKDGQKFVSLKLLNEPISTSPTGDIIPRELTDSPQTPGTTDLVIPIGRDVSDSLPQNATQPHPMLKGIPISNVQVFDAQTIIKVIESCNCSNLKFLIPILKRPQSAIVVANSEYPGIAN